MNFLLAGRLMLLREFGKATFCHIQDGSGARVQAYVQRQVVGEVQELDARPGDVYLLCSDGLTDMVGDMEIEETLVAAEGHWERAAQRLIDLANNHGGHDNISVILAGVGAPR